MRIGLVGGTGKEGRGLGVRWARAGHQVALGSRDGARGAEAARLLSENAGVELTGGDNLWAVGQADVVVLCVPYQAHTATLEELKPVLEGRVLIDITVPLVPPNVRKVQLPPGQSAAMEAQAILGRGTRVVAALHHVSSTHLADPDSRIECDVLVCADDEEARELAITLIGDLGLRGLDAGALCNAVALEALTPVLLHMNRRYKSPGTGLRITGLGRA